MNKKGSLGDIVQDNILHIILVVIFLVLLITFVNKQLDGVGVWEDYYSKEMARVVNLANPGDEIRLDVQKISVMANNNRVSLSDMFVFDNSINQVCVKLSRSSGKCYPFYNDVEVRDINLQLAEYEESGETKNILYFNVTEVSDDIE